jgi:hypothetical protein
MTKHFWKKNHHQQQSKIMVNYIAKGKEKRTALVLLLAKKSFEQASPAAISWSCQLPLFN